MESSKLPTQRRIKNLRLSNSSIWWNNKDTRRIQAVEMQCNTVYRKVLRALRVTKPTEAQILKRLDIEGRAGEQLKQEIE